MTNNGMFVRESGQGKPVVLVHGFPGNAQDWGRVAAALAASHRVIQPDLLGFGQSVKPSSFAEVWVEAQVAALEAQLDARKIERFALVGHDYGGPVAVALAARRAERVTHLVLSACNVFRDPPLQPPMRLLPVPGFGRVVEAGLFSSLAIKLMGKSGTRQGDVYPVTNPPDELRSLRLIFATALRDLEHFGVVEDALPSLTMPALVAWGERDPFFPIAHAQRITASVPRGQLQVYPGVGHFPHIEAAAQYAADIHDLIVTY